MADDIVIGNDELIAKFQQLGEALQGDTLANAVQAGGMVVVNAAKDNIKKRGLIQTRTLSRSIHQEVVESSKDQAAVEIGTDVEHGAIHEFGGTITAKKSKYLAIPVGSYRGSPLKHPSLRLRKTAGGTLIMIDRGGTVQYVLKKSVEIPAKPYLRPAADENHDKIESAMAKTFKQQIEQIAGNE